MVGKRIELFLVDGEAGGIATANVSGWTGPSWSPRAKTPSTKGTGATWRRA